MEEFNDAIKNYKFFLAYTCRYINVQPMIDEGYAKILETFNNLTDYQKQRNVFKIPKHYIVNNQKP